jgi:alkylation response protein AidB-like acyl-CoA dehydrogenase
MGLRASNTVALTFENCFVPEGALLGAPEGGFKIAMMALDGGRIGIASQACGIASAALDEATRYAKDRKQFGRPIGDFQAIQWHLANSLKEAGRPFSQEAAMAKLYASEAANRVCQRAVQVLGGYGYTREFSVERHMRDVRVTTIYEGTSEIQRTVIARNVLRDAGLQRGSA